MKILIIITHGKIGGATNSVFWLAKGLKEKGIEIKVGFGEGDYLKEKLLKADIPFVNFKWLKRTHNPLANIFFIFELKKFLDKERFDVVHFNSTNALFGAIGAKLSKTKPKTIFTFRGLSILDPNYRKHFYLKPFYFLVFKLLLLFIDVPVFVCKDNFEWAKESGLTNKGVIIYNGIPIPEFLSKEEALKFFERETNINLKDKFIIGSIGRLDYQKNYEFLIEIFPEILRVKKNAICIIIGDGPEKEKLKKLIQKLNLKNKIFLLGDIKDASKYLRGFDLFILPSRYEGLSITLIEALFAKIPILATDVGGNKEIIGENFVFKLNDKNYFLDKLTKIFSIKFSTYQKELFIIENTVNSYLGVYKKLSAQKNLKLK
ncbi:MAG: glycosyltransferase [Candidatus Aenigmatarchaeota archaeon]